jgi:hypothetical protein
VTFIAFAKDDAPLRVAEFHGGLLKEGLCVGAETAKGIFSVLRAIETFHHKELLSVA